MPVTALEIGFTLGCDFRARLSLELVSVAANFRHPSAYLRYSTTNFIELLNQAGGQGVYVF